MFTGIIEHLGTIESLQLKPGAGHVTIHVPSVGSALAVSNSIAVNGCCLTVVELSDAVFAADLSLETMRRTAFGEMKPGMPVNLERPLTAGKELGGHFVQGHVDGVGRIARLEPEGDNWWLGVRVPVELDRYVAMKGSIAIDGISLTVAGVAKGVVEAAIVPYTYAHTNLRGKSIGDAVNLEADIL
ncbi:MAG TPA: riboflavin synthase, partial [Candidatus Solibacter sp.]|nr:riboflavin synthase [Candidatus Solibacter sp.]